jgi:hypothetical protein
MNSEYFEFYIIVPTKNSEGKLHSFQVCKESKYKQSATPTSVITTMVSYPGLLNPKVGRGVVGGRFN